MGFEGDNDTPKGLCKRFIHISANASRITLRNRPGEKGYIVSEQVPLANAPDVGRVQRDYSARERVRLDRELSMPAHTARHPYWIVSQTIRGRMWLRARPFGFFQSALAALKDYRERTHPEAKFAQVQSHRLASRLGAGLGFEDPYGTPGDLQLHAYVEVVRSDRQDLDEDLVRLLPGVRRRRREEAFH